MAGLLGKTIGDSYKSILRVDNDSDGVGTTDIVITDGKGTKTCLKVSDDILRISPQNDNTIGTLRVKNTGGSNILAVDTTNSVVKVNENQDYANTQYAYFGVNYADFSNLADDTHYPIPFSVASGGATATNDVDFGTGTDPDTSFTTANTDTQYASQIVPMMWLVPDNISIDSVTSIEGAGSASGDTTRMHLQSFTFNSGATSCLTSGTLLAHNSDVTNGGNEQAYKSSWTVDSSDVSANKVILAFFRKDTENSHYSLNITIKYHLR